MSKSARIERLALRYRISTRHPAPAVAQAGLDRDLRDRLPTSCAAALAEALPDSEGLVVINRLDLGVGLMDRADAGRRLGSLCARAISRGVARALAGELGPGRVARYRSRDDYWACFLYDLARGAAAERWQYQSLARLWTAPVGAAFQAARESGVPVSGVLAALAHRGRLGLVAAALTEPEAAAIIDLWETGPGPATPPSATDVLSALAQPEAARLGAAALALFLAGTLAAGWDGEPLGAESTRVVREAAIVAVARRSLPGSAASSRRALLGRGGRVAAAVTALESRAPELAERILGGPESVVSAAPTAEGEVTPFGGVFLLLPALAELDRKERLPAAGRFLVLIKCLPPESRLTAWYDPALCLAAGTEAPPRLADLRALGAPPRPGRTWAGWAAAVLHAFARRLPRFERSSPGYVMSNFVVGSAVYGVDDEGVWATLPQVPLRLVLRLSGWPGGEHVISWLPGGRLRLGSDQ